MDKNTIHILERTSLSLFIELIIEKPCNMGIHCCLLDRRGYRRDSSIHRIMVMLR